MIAHYNTMTEYTTVRISKDARESLKEIGNMGDTYSDVIENLVYMYKYRDK